MSCLSLRSEFEGLLEKSPSEANAYLADPEKYSGALLANPDAAAREQLEKVVELLVTDRWEKRGEGRVCVCGRKEERKVAGEGGGAAGD